MVSVFKPPHCRQIETPRAGRVGGDLTCAFRYRFPAFLPIKGLLMGAHVSAGVSDVTHLGVPKALPIFVWSRSAARASRAASGTALPGTLRSRSACRGLAHC